MGRCVKYLKCLNKRKIHINEFGNWQAKFWIVSVLLLFTFNLTSNNFHLDCALTVRNQLKPHFIFHFENLNANINVKWFFFLIERVVRNVPKLRYNRIHKCCDGWLWSFTDVAIVICAGCLWAKNQTYKWINGFCTMCSVFCWTSAHASPSLL